MALEGFTVIHKDAEEFDKIMSQTTTLSGSQSSPFQENALFTVDMEDPVAITVNQVNGRAFTIINLASKADGRKCELWLTTLAKEDVDSQGNRVVSTASLNVSFRDKIAGKELTHKEFAQAFCDLVGDKAIRVVRTHYPKVVPTKRGPRQFPASLVGFELAD